MTDVPIRVRDVEFRWHPMTTRFPFHYGIASMSQLPHLFVRATIESAGRIATGMSADHLPPKWFTKNPDTSFQDDDLPAMQSVIRHAARIAVDLPPAKGLFRWWRELYEAQSDWAKQHQVAPLLANFGVSLIERAALDAACRLQKTTLFSYLKSNGPNIQLGEVRPELRLLKPADALASRPQPTVKLRHTIGLADPLTAADRASYDVEDELPLTLEENIREYGLRYFKIKLGGDPTLDCERLQRIATLIRALIKSNGWFTLDGNEQYDSISSFRSAFEQFQAQPQLRDFFDTGLLFVEQPVHRERALDPSVATELSAWSNAPAIIIDESDAQLSSFPQAVELGYRGTSHKNCKGIFKSIFNAASAHQQRSLGNRVELSAEDLANVGPIALQQDLAMVAALGIEHVERNGHHYFAGLSHLSPALQEQIINQHGDLYQQRHNGFVAVSVSNGTISIKSVNDAPFGCHVVPDLSPFVPWDWRANESFSV